MQRYFVYEKDNNMFNIMGTDYHHIVNVMRMNIDDLIEVIHDGKIYLCRIDKITDTKVIATIVNEINEDSELKVDIIIAQALVKEDKLDYILQKGTELGVNYFIPLIMERSVIKLDQSKIDSKLLRWQKICKEASEQSKRTKIPIINKPMTIKELINVNADYKIVCSTNEKQQMIKKVLHELKEHDKILIVIGPEGGISDTEEKLLIENDFIPVSLGNRILRTETASLFIASIINYELMR